MPEYNGTGYQLGIVVRWQWIILPAALVLLSIIFLIAIIIRTAQSPASAWKGSPLTLLLFGVDQETKQGVYGHAERYRGIENAVSKRKVMLTGEPGRLWRFEAPGD